MIVTITSLPDIPGCNIEHSNWCLWTTFALLLLELRIQKENRIPIVLEPRASWQQCWGRRGGKRCLLSHPLAVSRNCRCSADFSFVSNLEFALGGARTPRTSARFPFSRQIGGLRLSLMSGRTVVVEVAYSVANVAEYRCLSLRGSSAVICWPAGIPLFSISLTARMCDLTCVIWVLLATITRTCWATGSGRYVYRFVKFRVKTLVESLLLIGFLNRESHFQRLSKRFRVRIAYHSSGRPEHPRKEMKLRAFSPHFHYVHAGQWGRLPYSLRPELTVGNDRRIPEGNLP
jgi:hypothetical protein